MIPFFFVANKTNYSRWIAVYIIDMLHLPSEIHAMFKDVVRPNRYHMFRYRCVGSLCALLCTTLHRFSKQKSCGYTWELCLVVKMVGDIFQFTICVACFLISHVRFYPPFTLLLIVTLPLLFQDWDQICLQNLENIT